jgi:hypothetical protein
MSKQETIKDKVLTKFLEELSKVSLGPLVNSNSEINILMILGTKNFIKLNENVTLEDFNTYLKSKGFRESYKSFVDFIIEFYSVKAIKIIKEISSESNISIPTISFSEAEGNTILINS